MHSILTFLNSIVLLGALQGFIICGLLLFSRKTVLSNKILAVLIFLLAWASLKIYLNNQDWFATSRAGALIEALVPFFVIMPVGPLIFFYIRSFIEPNFKITGKLRRHFIPVIIDFVPLLTVVIYLIGLLTHLLKKDSIWNTFIDTYYVYSDIPRWLSVSFYLRLSARFLSSLKNIDTVAVNQAADHRWLRHFISVFMVFQVIWLLYLIPYVIPGYTDKLLGAVDWFPLYLPLTILIYWLGFKGYIMAYRQPVASVKRTAGKLSMIPASNIEEMASLLKKSMEEHKLYLDPALNLSLLATHTGLSQKTISLVLNQHLHKSFNEFINGYRVEALKEKIRQPGMDNLTIAGVAYECGFNSQATFQRTFKDVTGMSPSEFRKSAPGY